jgi:hypothetical protein
MIKILFVCVENAWGCGACNRTWHWFADMERVPA